MKRVIWIILDSFGIGALPDAENFGDKGANTFKHIWDANGGLNVPNMLRMGLGNIDGLEGIQVADEIIGAYGRSRELSNGKDTTVGHWEMTGIISEKAFPVFPDGFPKEINDKFIEENNLAGILGNCVASGTVILEEHGEEAREKDIPIVYTSADSVYQIAYHVGCDDRPEVSDPAKVERLYKMCDSARKILVGDYEVARVIARPFIGVKGSYVRTADRRDYAILPPESNLLYQLKEQGYKVTAVGKIGDIFAGSGISEAIHTGSNMEGVDVTLECMGKQTGGLIFTNLVEFDSTWGHRRDAAGYGKALEEFDARIPEIIDAMTEEDVLIINADHGCDPTYTGTDHTREYIPIMVYGNGVKAVNFGTRESFADIGQTIADILGAERIAKGKSFFGEVTA